LDPELVLQRGYAVMRSASGGIVRSVGEVAVGEVVAVQVGDGVVRAKVIGNALEDDCLNRAIDEGKQTPLLDRAAALAYLED
jgi:hypothetical protein